MAKEERGRAEQDRAHDLRLDLVLVLDLELELDCADGICIAVYRVFAIICIGGTIHEVCADFFLTAILLRALESPAGLLRLDSRQVEYQLVLT